MPEQILNVKREGGFSYPIYFEKDFSGRDFEDWKYTGR